MTDQEQIKEIDKQSERRINYCVRIQEAFNYKGNYDHEDIPSILVDFEMEIKNDILPKDSVVLSKEEWKQIKNSLYYSKEELERKLQKSSKDTAKEICDFILEHWEEKQFVECDWLRVAIAEKYGIELTE